MPISKWGPNWAYLGWISWIFGTAILGRDVDEWLIDSWQNKASYRCLILCTRLHTVPIWTFTFQKKSGSVKVILKANFKPVYRPVLWTFWSENSGFLNSFFFYFLQELSNPLLFAHSYCYFKKVEMLWSHICIKLQLRYVKSYE